MKTLVQASLLAFAVAGASGCAVVTSSMPSATNMTGEAWYTEAIGFAGLTWGSKVWYCAPPSGGPALCKEAKLIKLTDAEVKAEQPK